MKLLVLFLNVLLLVSCAGPTQKLISSARKGNLQGLMTEWGKGINLMSRDETGATALHWAALEGRTNAAAFLLTHGVAPDIRETSTGYTPLHMAALKGQDAMVLLLLHSGAAVDARDKTYGNTPLFWANASGRLSTVKLLVENGADPRVTNFLGFMPIHVVAREGFHDLLLFYLSLGIVPDQVHKATGVTPLMVACQMGNYPGMRILLTNGADPYRTNNQGKSSLDIAQGLKRKILFQFMTNYSYKNAHPGN